MDDYYLYITLNRPINLNLATKNILQKGFDSDCVYYLKYFALYNESLLPLALDEAFQKGLTNSRDTKIYFHLYVKYKDTYFNFYIEDHSNLNQIKIVIGGFGDKWVKTFTHNCYHIDLARYIIFAKDLLSEFKITKFETEVC